MFDTTLKQKVQELEQKLEKLNNILQYDTLEYCCTCGVLTRKPQYIRSYSNILYQKHEQEFPYCINCKPAYDVINDSKIYKLVEQAQKKGKK